MYIYTSVLYWPLPFRECPRSRSEVGLRRGPSGTLGYETEPLSKPKSVPGGTPPVRPPARLAEYVEKYTYYKVRWLSTTAAPHQRRAQRTQRVLPSLNREKRATGCVPTATPTCI